jgi:hypothetical protein
MALTASEIAELNRLSTENLLEFRDSIAQEIQDLRSKWSELSAEQNPELDQEILDVFKVLTQREDLLPELQRVLDTRRRAVERAA